VEQGLPEGFMRLQMLRWLGLALATRTSCSPSSRAVGNAH
jgi:hypothetical protein